jgi:hypothetical protein
MLPRFFAWLDAAGIRTLVDIEPLHVATYIEALQERMAKPTVKQHLAAIRMLFDWLVTGGTLATNPATSVRGPKHVIKRGKTPVLTTDQARVLIESIDTSTLVGLRDRALIGVMTVCRSVPDAPHRTAARDRALQADGRRQGDRHLDPRRGSGGVHDAVECEAALPAHRPRMEGGRLRREQRRFPALRSGAAATRRPAGFLAHHYTANRWGLGLRPHLARKPKLMFV